MQVVAEAAAPSRGWWNHPLVTVLLFATLVFGLWWLLHDVDLDRTWTVLRRADPLLLTLAVVANLASQVTRALVWAALLAPHSIPFARLVRYELTAQGASAVTPEGGGELIRLAQLRSEGVPVATTVAIVAVHKLLSSAALAPLLVVLFWAPTGSLPGWGIAAASGYVAVMAALVAALAAVARPPRPEDADDGAQGGRAGRLRAFLGDLRQGVAPLRRRGPLVASVVSALSTRLLDIAAALMIMEALGMPYSPALAVFALLLVELSNVLPTAPGQLGSFDAAVLIAAAGFVPGESALAFGVLLHAQQVLPQAVAAGVVVLVAAGSRAALRHRRLRARVVRHG